jgi:sugar lactone lactonase YvrE
VCSGVPGATCPVDVCAPTEELLGCYTTESDPGLRPDLPDEWDLAVQAGVPVTLAADTVDVATAADLCFEVTCPGQAVVSGDDEMPCTFPVVSAACPQKTFVPPATGTCGVRVALCSRSCADDGRARYALRVSGGVPTLVNDDGVPVMAATGTLPCGTVGDRYRFQASPFQQVIVRTDTTGDANAASLCITGSCSDGTRFDEYGTIDCSATAPTYRCAETRFLPANSHVCRVQVTACRGECAAAQAGYRLEVAGTGTLTLEANDAPLGTCGNGVTEATEVCGEPGLLPCPGGWSCVSCLCQRSMPNLLGLRVDQARTTLASLGIPIGRLVALAKETQPPAAVQAQSIPAATLVRSGDVVDLEVSLPPDPGLFLTRNGYVIESEANAQAYYQTIDPCFQRTTLDEWRGVNLFGATEVFEASAIYENHNDLGFGRRMHARNNASDFVAYYVQNFPTVDDAWRHPERILATVAMEYSRPVNPATCTFDFGQPPFVKFFTFGPDGNRITRVDLDGRGEKFQPQMCTVCHGGSAGLAVGGVYPNKGNIGAQFIPFDLDSFEYSRLNPLLSRGNQLPAFKELNRTVLAATSPASQTLISGWYGGSNLPGSFNGGFVPTGWTSEAALYDGVIELGCRGCHTQLAPDFDGASDFAVFGSTIQDYVCGRARMPLALRTFQNFWLGIPGKPYGPQALNDEIGGEYCDSLGPTVSASASGVLPADPAQGLTAPRAVAVDDVGNVYFSSFTANAVPKKVVKYDPVTQVGSTVLDTTLPGMPALTNATGIAVDHGGNVFVAGEGNDVVLRVTPQGAVATVLGPGGDGVHGFDRPFGDCVGVDDAGNLYVAGTNSNNVFKRTPGGQITQIAGPGGNGQPPLLAPYSIAVARDGTTWAAGATSNNVLRIDPDGTITEVVDVDGDGQGHGLVTPVAIAVGRQGTVVVVAQGSKTAFRIWADGRIEHLNVPIVNVTNGLGATIDEADNAYVSIRAEHNVYQVTPGGTVTRIFDASSAGGNAGPYDMAVDPRLRHLWIGAREKTGVVRVVF